MMRAAEPRRSAMRALAIAIALACAVAPLAGCAEPLADPIPAAHPDDETPRRGGTLRLASFGDIRNLDPAVSPEALSIFFAQLAFAGLVDFDMRGEVVPDLARRVDEEDAGKLYRFALHENVRFHDGSELTADDVKRSIERALHPSTPSPWASFYEAILGFDAYTSGKSEELEGVRVEGRYVVSIRLARPDATFLRVLALAALRPVCPSGGRRYDDAWHPCGAGPFKLPPGGWEHGRSLTVVRHDGYFRADTIHLDAVVFTYGMNPVTQRFKFESGELDILRDLTQPDLQRFQRDPRWAPLGRAEPEKTIAGVSMNVEVPPFDNVEVRRAVAKAINREHLRLLKPGAITPATQLLPPAVPGHDPSFAGQEHDLAAALEHMRRGGYPFDPQTGEGGYPHALPYYVYPQGYDLSASQVLQQALAKIGLRLDIRVVSYPTYLALTHRRKRVPLSPQGWSQDFPDPSDFFEPLFSSKAINDEDSNNTSFYANPAFDALLEEAHGELDPARRKSLYDRAHRMLIDDAPWAFTHFIRFFEVRQAYVRGYEIHPVWSQHVKHAWIDREAARLARGRPWSRGFFSSIAHAFGGSATSTPHATRGTSLRAVDR
jgi:ABC-type transport system substrate-binding protein